jgi:hypothetical protein
MTTLAERTRSHRTFGFLFALLLTCLLPAPNSFTRGIGASVKTAVSSESPPETSGAPVQREVVVSTTAEFQAALASATAGTVISLRPGTYAGGYHRSGLTGTATAPIVIQAQDRAQPPVITGGNNGLGLTDASYVTFRDLIFDRPRQNGVNVDDGESFDTPSHHITFTRVQVRDLPGGNRDGIKLSGVTDFVIEDSTIERWGSDGSAVDMVGCHRGVIRSSVFRHTPGMPVGNGVQAKGGSANITISGNRFENAAARAVQLGGDTGLQFFRPLPPGRAEVSDVVVERNVFVGGETAIAFVSSDGGAFRFNTIYLPSKYLLRILQEQDGATFVRTRNGVFTDNLVYWTGERMVNIGANTEPMTFTFARNWWYRADNPGGSRPDLPSTEIGGVYGADLTFIDPPRDLRTLGNVPHGAHGGR